MDKARSHKVEKMLILNHYISDGWKDTWIDSELEMLYDVWSSFIVDIIEHLDADTARRIKVSLNKE